MVWLQINNNKMGIELITCVLMCGITSILPSIDGI